MSTQTGVGCRGTGRTSLAGGTDDTCTLLSVRLALAGCGGRVRTGNEAGWRLSDRSGPPPFHGRVPRETDTGHSGRPRLLTDGGQPEAKPESETEDRQQRLLRIFEDLTGSALLVEQQDSDSRRCLDDDETRLAADVADVAESDGLSDAITSPETTNGDG